MSTDDKSLPSSGPGAGVKELRERVGQTQAELGVTLSALEHKLSPSELGEKAKVEFDYIEARVKVAVKEALQDAKGVLGEEIHEAKGALKEQLHEANELARRGLIDAKEALKKDIHAAVANTKEAVREATLGRVENIATQAGDIMITTRDTLVDTVRQNPIPAAMAGIGIAWLLMNRSSASHKRDSSSGRASFGANPYAGMAYGGSSREPAGQNFDAQSFDGRVRQTVEGGEGSVGQILHRAGEAVHHVGSALGGAGVTVAGAAHDAAEAARDAVGHGVESASHVAHDVSDSVGRLAHGASDAAAHLAHDAANAAGHLAHQSHDTAGNLVATARGQARRVENTLQSTLETNPLAFGAVAVMIGAAVGYSLPRTEKEDAWMGQARDHVLEGATDLAKGAARSLHHMTDEAAETAKKALAQAST